MAGSPIFSVNFTNRRNSAVLNYHKSWSWSESLRVSSLKYTQHYLVDVYMMKQAQLQKGTNAWRLFPPVFRGGRGRDLFNQNSNRSDREKWSTSKGGPLFSKLFRLDEPIHWVLDRNFRTFLLNGSRPNFVYYLHCCLHKAYFWHEISP